MPKQSADQILAKMADTYRKLGDTDSLQHARIGTAACELLATQKTITAADLIQHFERLIKQSRSAKGETEADLDPERILWEGVIKRLSSLRSP